MSDSVTYESTVSIIGKCMELQGRANVGIHRLLSGFETPQHYSCEYYVTIRASRTNLVVIFFFSSR